jgi:uncharacterized membrane protein
MHRVFLVLHIISGAVGLIAGTYAMIRRKGDRSHRITGQVFYYAMLGAAISAIALSLINPNTFLGMLGVFTLYLNLTGRRYVVASRTGNTGDITDWLLSLFMMCFALALVFSGLRAVVSSNSFGIVSVVFGLISLFMIAGDFRNYRPKTISNPVAIKSHLQRMCATYIASLTAFIVVNFPKGLLDVSLNFIPWLVPTVVVTPFIVKWSKRYTTPNL